MNLIATITYVVKGMEPDPTKLAIGAVYAWDLTPEGVWYRYLPERKV